MDPDLPLRTAIGTAYETFGKYPQPVKLDVSPVHDPARLRTLRTKPLGQLEISDLAGYAVSAMTTIGEVEDYKHFLPRILELAVHSGIIDPQNVALKLRYARWHEWPQEEKTAITDLFNEACIQAFNERTDEYLATPWFCALAILGNDLTPVMHAWESASSPNAALQLSQLLRVKLLFEQDADEMGYWSEIQIEVVKGIRAWLLHPAVRAKLASARVVATDSDIWMLDQALEERDRLIKQQVQ